MQTKGDMQWNRWKAKDYRQRAGRLRKAASLAKKEKRFADWLKLRSSADDLTMAANRHDAAAKEIQAILELSK